MNLALLDLDCTKSQKGRRRATKPKNNKKTESYIMGRLARTILVEGEGRHRVYVRLRGPAHAE
jgi:hypothetical protein